MSVFETNQIQSIFFVNVLLPMYCMTRPIYDKTFQKNVTLLSCTDSQKRNKRLKKLCSKMKWKYWNRNDVIGSEASVVIIYDHAYFRYESFTRAKHQLIIVTISSRYSSSTTSQLIGFGLRGIEIGEHNDRICSEYQKEVAKRFNIPPPLCSYKTNKKRIQKLR